MRLLLLIGLLIATPALAQTATPPAPTSTLSAAQATLAALPTYDPLGGTATRTPWATMAWPTLTPVSLVPRAWIGIGYIDMTPGGAYKPPPAPNFDAPDAPWEDTATGFSAINDGNLTRFIVFLIDVARTFYMWFATNFPKILLGARWLVIIMMVLYGIFYVWKGSKFAPPDPETRDELNDPRFFWSTFRRGSRYHYYTRGRRERHARRTHDVGSAWDMAEKEDAGHVYRSAMSENRRFDVERGKEERRAARNERKAARELERQANRKARIAAREMRRRGWL